MKKKLALLLSAIMVVGMIPATAFAVTTNTVSKIVTGQTDTVLGEDVDAPIFKMEDRNLEDIATPGEDVDFKVTLDNAEWAIPEYVGGNATGDYVETGDTRVFWGSNATHYNAGRGGIEVTKLSSTQIIVSVKDFYYDAIVDDEAFISFPINAELTGEGEATVEIDPMDSVVTAGTYKFANVVEGSTSTTINDTVAIREGNTDIETITIEEATAGTIEAGTMTFKLNGDFTWNHNSVANNPQGVADGLGFSVYPADSMVITGVDVDDETMEISYDVINTNRAKTITFTGLSVKADFDDVEVGEVCEVTINGNGIDKTTLEVGTATDYSVALSAENKTVPTFYSGRVDDETDSLKVTIKENIASSWITNRKATLTFPEGVKVLDVDVTKADKVPAGTTFTIKGNEVEFDFTNAPAATDKMKFEMTFQFSIDPRFEGDITAKLSGAAIGEDQEVVVGVAKSPITVTAETNKVSIDYRNVAIGDIIIEEAYAGALEKGKTLSLQLNTIDFDGDPTVEVVEGDIKIDEVEVDGGKINITIDSASAKTPATLKVTNIELFLDRALPAGDYSLKIVANDTYGSNTQDPINNALVPAANFGSNIGGDINNSSPLEGQNNKMTDAYFQNSVASGEDCDETVLFDTRNKTVLSNYVEVVTAGRDQDDSTFTTKIQVTIGSNTMIVGDAEKALDVPAYISNGYTMMPVRAVTEALSGSAIVRWDDPTKTVTITFGSRVISMSVGSSSMLINGVPVQMQAAVEITGERAFIPLRDLGYALGLNDSKIAWDDATKTATLN